MVRANVFIGFASFIGDAPFWGWQDACVRFFFCSAMDRHLLVVQGVKPDWKVW